MYLNSLTKSRSWPEKYNINQILVSSWKKLWGNLKLTCLLWQSTFPPISLRYSIKSWMPVRRTPTKVMILLQINDRPEQLIWILQVWTHWVPSIASALTKTGAWKIKYWKYKRNLTPSQRTENLQSSVIILGRLNLGNFNVNSPWAKAKMTKIW